VLVFKLCQYIGIPYKTFDLHIDTLLSILLLIDYHTLEKISIQK
jgi:hypothetical protein